MSAIDAAALRAALRARFEIERHPLAFESEVAVPGGPYDLRRLAFRTAGGEGVRGLMLLPPAPRPAPALLLIHAHGFRYDIGADELTDGRPALHAPAGPAFAAMGIATLMIDLPCFGTRAGVGESAAAKAALWRGGSLAGQMLGELAAAFEWLAADARIDASRVGVFGISMGATLGYWLAAVEPRLALCAHLSAFADFGRLIALGAHDLHGIYLTVPGLLSLADNGTIAGLVAPRPQFVGLGDADPLTPPEASEPALATLVAAYRDRPDALTVVREESAGHTETAAERAALTTFLTRHLALP